jgi:hypothetical protein
MSDWKDNMAVVASGTATKLGRWVLGQAVTLMAVMIALGVSHVAVLVYSWAMESMYIKDKTTMDVDNLFFIDIPVFIEDPHNETMSSTETDLCQVVDNNAELGQVLRTLSSNSTTTTSNTVGTSVPPEQWSCAILPPLASGFTLACTNLQMIVTLYKTFHSFPLSLGEVHENIKEWFHSEWPSQNEKEEEELVSSESSFPASTSTTTTSSSDSSLEHYVRVAFHIPQDDRKSHAGAQVQFAGTSLLENNGEVVGMQQKGFSGRSESKWFQRAAQQQWTCQTHIEPVYNFWNLQSDDERIIGTTNNRPTPTAWLGVQYETATTDLEVELTLRQTPWWHRWLTLQPWWAHPQKDTIPLLTRMQGYIEWISATPIQVLEGCQDGTHTTRDVVPLYPPGRLEAWHKIHHHHHEASDPRSSSDSGSSSTSPTMQVHVLQCPIPTHGSSSRTMYIRVRMGTVASLPPVTWDEMQQMTNPQHSRHELLRRILQR